MEIIHNKLIIKQKVEVSEVLLGFESKNKFQILTSDNQEFLYAFEESNWFERVMFKQARSLTLKIIDKNKREVLEIKKKFAFFHPHFEVFENKQKIGEITTSGWFFKNSLDIIDRNKHVVLKGVSTFSHPWTYNIFRADGNEVNVQGTILKKFKGFGKTLFTDADHFNIDFKNIEDDELKTLVLALAFAIDLYIFER